MSEFHRPSITLPKKNTWLRFHIFPYMEVIYSKYGEIRECIQEFFCFEFFQKCIWKVWYYHVLVSKNLSTFSCQFSWYVLRFHKNLIGEKYWYIISDWLILYLAFLKQLTYWVFDFSWGKNKTAIWISDIADRQQCMDVAVMLFNVLTLFQRPYNFVLASCVSLVV